MSDITVSNDIHTFMQSASNSAARDNLGVGDSDAVNHASLTLTGNAEAVEFIGDLEGAVRFNAKAGEALTKGDAVYVSGISGNLPVVSKADSSSSATMPSFGLAASTVSLNAAVQIVTFGTLSSIDTSSYSLGDTLYVNGTGTLSATKPTGESNLVQNIGKVQRVHASAGSIKVGGAGRTNDTPNLDENKIFIGNSSNAASTAAIGTVITDNASSVKTSYESNSNTNAFTDAEKTKLSGIATGAEVNAVDSVNSQTGSVTLDADDIDDTSTTHKFATAAQLTKIDGVESGATADQTGAEIKSLYEAESNTNAFTDAEKTKLSGIATGAEVNTVDSVNTQTGAVVLDADDISDAATTNKFTTASDISKLAAIEAGADVTDATNVNAAGATMNTDTDVSGNSWVVDEDSMSSNDATKVPTQQSVKAYVDANTSSGDATSIQGTDVDSSVGSPSDGDILVYRSAGSDFVLESKPAAGSNPSASDITDATADGIALITSSDANPFTDADESKLDGIATGAEVNAVDSVNTQTGAVVLDADDISDAATTNKFTTASDISKLAGIEAGATADQTGAEIKTAYEGESDTNAFTDAEKTKLSGIETGATADQDLSSYQLQPSEGAFANGDKTKLDGIATGAEVNVNADWNSSSGDSQILNKPTLGTAAATASSDYATAAQGTTADSAMQDLSDDTTPQLGGNLDVNGNDIISTSNADIDLAADGTGSVVVRGNDTSGKIVLNCENNSHGVTIKGPPHSAAADYTLTLPDDDGSASQTLTTDGSGNLSWTTPSGSYGDSDVDTHLNTSSASSNQVLSWNGSDYAWTDQSGGGGTNGTANRIISIDAGALVARTTNGAATATEEYATNDVMSDHFLFDGATEEGVQFRFHMPADWDGNAVNAKFYWDASTGASAADGVTWGIAMQAFQNDDALDNAFGTSVDTDDAVIAVGDLHVTGLSSDITIAGSPSAGDMVIAEVTRVVGDANDTMTEDAKLVGVTIHYTASVSSQVSINAQTGTTYTTVLTDASKLVTLNNGSAITLTIPPNSSVAYPVGTKIDLLQIGAGQVTVAGGVGVTVNSTPTLKLRAQYSGASCIQYAANTWILVGDLAAS